MESGGSGGARDGDGNAVNPLPSKEAFVERLNTTFAMRVNDATDVALELVGVDDHASSEIQQAFSLMFRASPDAPAEQGSYRLDHDTLPAMEIFLVPVRRDHDGLFFEAVFNYRLERS